MHSCAAVPMKDAVFVLKKGQLRGAVSCLAAKDLAFLVKKGKIMPAALIKQLQLQMIRRFTAEILCQTSNQVIQH